MRRIIWLTGVLGLLVYSVRAQQALDSLINKVQTQPVDTLKVGLFLDIAHRGMEISADTAFYYLDAAQEIIKDWPRESGEIAAERQSIYRVRMNYWYGQVNKQVGHYKASFHYFYRTLQQAQAYGHGYWAGKTERALGNLHNMLGNYDSSLVYFDQALARYAQSNEQLKEARTYSDLAIVYRNKGEYKRALTIYDQAKEIIRNLADTSDLHTLYAGVGIIHYLQGDMQHALENFIHSAKIQEALNLKKQLAGAYNNIGVILMSMGDYQQAMQYYRQYLATSKELGDKRNIGKAYSNMGIIAQEQDSLEKARDYYQQSAEILKSIGDQQSLITTLANLSDVQIALGLLDAANKNLETGLQLARQIGDKHNEMTILINQSQYYLARDDYQQAVTAARQGLALATELEVLDPQRYAYQYLTEAYKALGIYSQALTTHEQFKAINDSLLNKSKYKQIADLKTRYETEKKEQENKILKKDNALKDQTIQNQRLLIAGGALMVVLIIWLAIAIYIRRQQDRLHNQLLEYKNEEINQQKDELQAQNEYIGKQKDALQSQNQEIKSQHALVSRQKQQIADSINYASRIQKALLPGKQQLDEALGDNQYFVFYRPRDIVSGDFYWLYQQPERTLFVVGDGTGHGVPGAFMSVIGIHWLNQLMGEQPHLHAEQLLHAMHNGISEVLMHQDNDQYDGMELGVLIIDKQMQEVEYAGARMPLVYVSDDMHLIKGDRMPVGPWFAQETPNYRRHRIRLAQPHTFYLYTDGYEDQWGGAHQRKFMAIHFRALLNEISALPMPDQQHALEARLSNWMQHYPRQIDDILITGIKVGID